MRIMFEKAMMNSFAQMKKHLKDDSTPPPQSSPPKLVAEKNIGLPTSSSSHSGETMASQQDHYSLRWNNHQNHILRAFDTLLQTKTLVDVTLVCAETSIRAHKMVLSACSPFFQRVFAETPCKHPVIVLKDFRGWVVQAIVDFMYRGEISVPQEQLQTLIQAGESLQVRGLVENTSVAGNTPTPAASPDDFGVIDSSSLLPELEQCSSYDDEPPTMVAANSKLRLPSQIFSDNTQHNAGMQHHGNPPDQCTSPLPRRKQARPRRRSGDCGPHDLSSKPSSPTSEDADLKGDAERSKSEERSKSVDLSENNRPSSSLDEDNNTSHQESLLRQRHDEHLDGPENLCTKKITNYNQNLSNDHPQNKDARVESVAQPNTLNSNNNNNTSNNNNNNSNNNNNRIVLSLKDIRQLNKPPTISRSPNRYSSAVHNMAGRMAPGGDGHSMKSESMEGGHLDNGSPFHMEQMDLSMAAAAAAAAHQHHQHQMAAASGMLGMHSSSHGHDRLEDVTNRMGKDFTGSSPMSLPSHFNPPDGPPHPPSPLTFPGMSSALGLTPPHMFALDSSLGLFPPGMDPGKLYNPLMEMSDPRGLPSDHSPFLKKKISRPKGQHSAPRGGPPRSWTNAELTEALQHVWNKKMTTSQASRIFGIPYNSLLMYVRGKYGKSLKLEQLRKDCISGPPIELLTMGLQSNNNNSKGLHENRNNKDLKDMVEGQMHHRSSSSEPDLLSSPNPLFNPFPPGFYPDFSGGFPSLPLGMLNLLPPAERHHQPSMHGMSMDEDCKSDRSKQSLEDDFPQPLALSRDDVSAGRRELLHQNGQD